MNDTPGWASPGSAPSDPSDGRDGASVPSPGGPADANEPGVQWSKEQPPAGQWSPPTGAGAGQVPPQPPQGWGGGGGWAPQPAVAKPGVIPLRPLGIGEILDGAVSTMRRHWRPVLAISLTVAVVTEIGRILVQRYAVPAPTQISQDATPSEALAHTADSLQSALIASIPAALIALAATLVSSALLTVVISRSVLGQGVTVSDAWREARPRLLQLFGLTLLLPLGAAVAVTVGLVPGLLIGDLAGGTLAAVGGIGAVLVVVWLAIRFSLASPALMLERRGIIESLKRSAKLVNGSWWRIFGIQLLTGILAALVAAIIEIPFMIVALIADGDMFQGLMTGGSPEFSWTFLIVTGIGTVIASSITYPISAGVVVLLYVDQRIRREALDIELARAAGLTGQGPAASGAGPASGTGPAGS
ncbi:glycerophosphoryl diester phosphodiesterase membrane domain-containing protein [Streptomyces sp.]|uniref:glycerophosphoryl diester phosphodiesterase membrane domain-containing protein n=1 Tax=Streptomyces sp. TaxID=1931 RepID=UPI002F959BA2